MTDRREDSEFTAEERARLAAWDRYNAPLAANDERDESFEHRLIAAYHAAQEASLRIAETDDAAICRQIAADAAEVEGDGAGAAAAPARAAARPDAPGAAVAISPARLALVAFAGSALGAVISVMGLYVWGQNPAVRHHERAARPVVEQVAPAPARSGDRDAAPRWDAPRRPLHRAGLVPARTAASAHDVDGFVSATVNAIADCQYGTVLISHSYPHSGPTGEQHIDAQFAEKKTLQQSGSGPR